MPGQLVFILFFFRKNLTFYESTILLSISFASGRLSCRDLSRVRPNEFCLKCCATRAVVLNTVEIIFRWFFEFFTQDVAAMVSDHDRFRCTSILLGRHVRLIVSRMSEWTLKVSPTRNLPWLLLLWKRELINL